MIYRDTIPDGEATKRSALIIIYDEIPDDPEQTDTDPVYEEMVKIIYSDSDHKNFRVLALVCVLSSWRTEWSNDTYPYCKGLMESCLHKEETNYSISIPELAEAIYADIFVGRSFFTKIIRKASLINNLTKIIVINSLKAFLHPESGQYNNMQNVCLALFPNHVQALKDLFRKYNDVKSYTDWNVIFKRLEEHGEHEDREAAEIFREDTPSVTIFKGVYRPLLIELPRWSGMVTLSTCLLSMNSKLEHPRIHGLRSTALSLIEKHNMSKIDPEKINGFVEDLSGEIFK